MGISTVKSPWTSQRGVDQRLREGESPGSRSSPSNRPDSGHIAGHVGKSASGRASLRRDNTPTFDQPPRANRIIPPVTDSR